MRPEAKGVFGGEQMLEQVGGRSVPPRKPEMKALVAVPRVEGLKRCQACFDVTPLDRPLGSSIWTFKRTVVVPGRYTDRVDTRLVFT